jgi:hypothetical protein
MIIPIPLDFSVDFSWLLTYNPVWLMLVDISRLVFSPVLLLTSTNSSKLETLSLMLWFVHTLAGHPLSNLINGGGLRLVGLLPHGPTLFWPPQPTLSCYTPHIVGDLRRLLPKLQDGSPQAGTKPGTWC